MRKIIIIIVSIFLFLPTVYANQDDGLVNIYLFHSDSCPHCKEEIAFLTRLEKEYSNVVVYKYEVSDENTTQAKEKAEELYGIKIQSVPLTIIADKYYLGFSLEKMAPILITTVQYYSKYGYQDKFGEALDIMALPEVKETTTQSLNDYVKKNSKYSIMFGIESDDVEVTTASSLLGIKSAITISNIILNIIIVLLCRLEKDNKNKLLMYILYLVSAILLEITCIIGMLNYKTTISLMTILIIITIILSILKKNKHIIKYIPIFALPVITKLIQEKIFNNNIVVTLKSIFTINLLSKLNCIVNVIIYLSSFILINMVFIFLIDKFALLINKLAKELVKFSKIKED